MASFIFVWIFDNHKFLLILVIEVLPKWTVLVVDILFLLTMDFHLKFIEVWYNWCSRWSMWLVSVGKKSGVESGVTDWNGCSYLDWNIHLCNLVWQCVYQITLPLSHVETLVGRTLDFFYLSVCVLYLLIIFHLHLVMLYKPIWNSWF